MGELFLSSFKRVNKMRLIEKEKKMKIKTSIWQSILKSILSFFSENCTRCSNFYLLPVRFTLAIPYSIFQTNAIIQLKIELTHFGFEIFCSIFVVESIEMSFSYETLANLLCNQLIQGLSNGNCSYFHETSRTKAEKLSNDLDR